MIGEVKLILKVLDRALAKLEAIMSQDSQNGVNKLN
jgi:hypothetical protein